MRLINASFFNKKYPLSFSIPSKKQLSKLKRGSIVKVSNGKERFWVEITRIFKNEIFGKLRNDLIHGSKFGARIKLRKSNILQIKKG
jgi:hypothetical protein